MVAYLILKIQHMYLATIIFHILVLVCAWFYFSERKKDKAEAVIEEVTSSSEVLCSPQITVVFQKDLADDEELAREIADMYISNRAYYYSGKAVPIEEELLSEKDVYLRYNSIDFSSLKVIEV